MAATQPELLDQINDDFEDSVAFVARVLGRRPATVAARITSIDRRGVDVVTVDAAGEQPGAIDFAAPIDNVVELQTAMFELITRARAGPARRALTSAEREVAELATVRTFVAEVVAVERCAPALASCRGAVATISRRFSPTGPDTFVYVLLPPPGRAELTIDQSFTWEALRADARGRPSGRRLLHGPSVGSGAARADDVDGPPR